MAEEAYNPTIVLCPGQGAQHVGMGMKWAQQYPTAKKTFAEADDVLGIGLTQLCFEGPEDELNRTDVAQAALYTAAVACHRVLVEEGLLEDVIATAGLSLGEFTALHLAGAYDFATGLKLVRLRGQAMQDAAEASDGSMVALIGADEAQATELCDKARESDVMVPANFNCPGQIVVSGSKAACGRALKVAEEMGLRATEIAVAGAFHSPLMQPAADRLSAALDEVTWGEMKVPVISNVTALPHDDSDFSSVKDLLVKQLTSPVRWSDSMSWAIANLSGRYIELAPNKVLGGLMRRIDRKTKVENFAEPKS